VWRVKIWQCVSALSDANDLLIPAPAMFTLYDLSFVFFVSLTAIAVVGSAAGIVIQAQLPEGGAADWNVFIVVGSYVALVSVFAACPLPTWYLGSQLTVLFIGN